MDYPFLVPDREGTEFYPPSAIFSSAHRMVFLRGRMDTVSASFINPKGYAMRFVDGDDIADALAYLGQESSAPIKLVISSEGGWLYKGLIILDTIALLRPKLEVWTYVRHAQSFATIIAALGTPGRRYALQHARLHLHLPAAHASDMDSDKAQESLDDAQRAHFQRLNDIFLDLLLDHTDVLKLAREELYVRAGRETPSGVGRRDYRRQVYRWLEKSERYFFAREAIKAGIVDAIVTPKIHKQFFPDAE